ncbi:MAG: hypothetical protein Q7J57_08365 [Gemmobacter sp.]|nr:hypothetical protein [Gemmobacter sp.]
MSLIRPELARTLYRWREVIAATGIGLAGLWISTRGGWFLGPVGALVIAGAVGIGWMGWRRLRFSQPASAPGVVEIDEGQIGWFGPGIGGFVSLAELADLGLVTVSGIRCWRFRQIDGDTLLIPVAAQGADRLYDALTALPGIDGAALVAALDRPEDTAMIWRRRRLVAITGGKGAARP